MPAVEKQATFNASADEVWGIVSSFGDLPNWLPPVAKSETDGDGVGAVRTLTMQDGVVVKERLDAFDGEGRSLAYSMIDTGPLPLVDYRSTIRIDAEADDRCSMVWTGRFEVAGADEAEVVGVVESLYGSGLDTIAKNLAEPVHPAIAKWPGQAIT